MGKRLLLLIGAALAVALAAGGIAALVSSGPSQPQTSQAAGKDPCFKIGRMKWCVRTTADEIAGLVSPAAQLTGYGDPGETGPPPGVDQIRFNVPAAPGGKLICDNAGDHWECH